MRITLTQVCTRLPVEIDPSIITSLTRMAGAKGRPHQAGEDRTIIGIAGNSARWVVEEDLLKIHELTEHARTKKPA